MKKKDTEKEPPRKAGRPAGRPTGTTLGALTLSQSEIIRILKEHPPTSTDGNEPALLKVPKYQGGTNGKANSGRLYTPTTWNNCQVLLIRLTPDQAAELIRTDGNAKAAAIKQKATEPES